MELLRSKRTDPEKEEKPRARATDGAPLARRRELAGSPARGGSGPSGPRSAGTSAEVWRCARKCSLAWAHGPRSSVPGEDGR